MQDKDKNAVADELIRDHFDVEPQLIEIYRMISDNEDDPSEPIKLLEVNAIAISSEELAPFWFAPTKETPFSTVIAEVTPADLKRLSALGFPNNWDISRAQRHPRPAA